MPTRKKKSKAKTGGLAKFRTHIKKATAAKTRVIKGLEARLKKAKREKAAKAKKAASAFKRKRKK